jgi:hypothetical protein
MIAVPNGINKSFLQRQMHGKRHIVVKIVIPQRP